MTQRTTYRARCHCGAIRFRFTTDEITNGRRCNCSVCVRKGAVMSATYLRAADVEVNGMDRLSLYQFGDRDVSHYFCRTCGVYPFHVVAKVPADYDGPARPGDYRVNLGCVEGLDVLALPIDVIDGKSF